MEDKTTRIIAKITLAAAHVSNVDIVDLVSNKRHRKISETRYIVYYHLHKDLGFSASVIGKYFNQTKRNVLRGIQLLTGWANLYADVNERMNTIIEKIKEG